MTDRPIIFSAPMVRALLDGRKTMTRRLAARKGPLCKYCDGYGVAEGHPCYRCQATGRVHPPSYWRRVNQGDRLWVRENWRADDFAPDDPERTIYMADAPRDVLEQTKGIIRWRPCLHLPRNRSRLTLIVTAMKIERLQEIGVTDAIAEGVESWRAARGRGWRNYQNADDPFDREDGGARTSFLSLWASLHGIESWYENPEVVALTFTVHKQNIDTLPKAEAA